MRRRREVVDLSAAPHAAPPESDRVPGGFELVLDPDVGRLAEGRVLIGGFPLRLVRLTERGARVVAAWSDGAPVGDAAADGRLARRLVDGGLAHPRPRQGSLRTADVAIVVPARDRLEALGACLAALGPAGDVVVVDDGSRDADGVVGTAQAGRARVLRRSLPGGPAIARNAGLRATSAPIVAFVDSDCVPEPGWLEALLGHFDDPRVGAVAPRVLAAADGSLLGRFEGARFPLDLGPRPSAAGAGRRVPYVPAAALVVRRAAAGPGFVEALRYGEDVDFVWRLVRGGWAVRYEPASRVRHPHRATLLAWLAQRASYGSSAAPLARRHPGHLAPVAQSPASLAAWCLVAAGRPRAALGVAVGATGRWMAGLPVTPRLRRRALRLAVRAQGLAGRQLADAIWRAYPPLALPLALRSRRARALIALAAGLPGLLEWRERRPPLDPVRYLGLRVLDDLAYATGLWLGCARNRTLAPLVPRIVGRPAGSNPRARRNQDATPDRR